MQKPVEIYDTTLRDGTQAEDFSLSTEDKIRIALKLDDLGIHYIEGGWPGSNPKDVAFFQEIRNYHLKNAQIAAFGSTHHKDVRASKDANLRALIAAKTQVITIYGKSWTVHVYDALKTTLERNLELIYNSLAFLRQHVATLFYDAEHFFDGFKADPEYALATLERATEAGADLLVLCDTNGGSLPDDIRKIMSVVKKRFPSVPLGIHAHNDTDLAVANSLAAVKMGAIQVQGTINGVGERCGNANLCSIIPNLCLKLGIQCLDPENLQKLRAVSRFVMEQANLQPNRWQPYVGRSAFAHKGGVHVSAVKQNPMTYEHVDPALIGNSRRFPISDLSGKTSISMKAEELGIKLDPKNPVVAQALKELKELENDGFQFELAEASFQLLLNRAMGKDPQFFQVKYRRINDLRIGRKKSPIIEATVMLQIGEDEEHHVATGDGPVNALDCALRKALEKHYPALKKMKLTDYKVRILPGKDGTAAKVRVLIESTNGGEERWNTMGVSEDIIEASWQALVDSINYKLYRDEKGENKG